MLTVGVEEEFLVVDSHGRLSFTGPTLLSRAEENGGELQRELSRCQVESATSVCRTVDEILSQLGKLRAALATAAHTYDARLVATGTPHYADNRSLKITPLPRYRRMAEHFGAITQVGSTCGCHVHVAVPDRETGVRVSNHVRRWLPLLLAVTANSPFHDGADTAYASWRHVLWARWPSAGPPPHFGSLDQYEASVEALLCAEAMLDRGMVYWDIRLSDDHPTLEFRVSDVAVTVAQATLLAVLVRGLVTRALNDIEDRRPAPELPTEVLRANLWRAARDGFTGSCLDPDHGRLVPAAVQLQRLVDDLRPILTEAGDADFVQSVLADLRESGNGAQRQRAAYKRRRCLQDVVDALTVEP